jgi:hypothetical protein
MKNDRQMMDVKPTLPVGAKRQINLDDIASTIYRTYS